MEVPVEHPELFEGLTRVQHMVEKGVMDQVPEAFIQPPHMRSAARSLDLDLQIPVIDMALLNRGPQGKKQVQADITRACEQYGFFQVLSSRLSHFPTWFNTGSIYTCCQGLFLHFICLESTGVTKTVR